MLFPPVTVTFLDHHSKMVYECCPARRKVRVCVSPCVDTFTKCTTQSACDVATRVRVCLHAENVQVLATCLQTRLLHDKIDPHGQACESLVNGEILTSLGESLSERRRDATRCDAMRCDATRRDASIRFIARVSIARRSTGKTTIGRN